MEKDSVPTAYLGSIFPDAIDDDFDYRDKDSDGLVMVFLEEKIASYIANTFNINDTDILINPYSPNIFKNYNPKKIFAS